LYAPGAVLLTGATLVEEVLFHRALKVAVLGTLLLKTLNMPAGGQGRVFAPKCPTGR